MFKPHDSVEPGAGSAVAIAVAPGRRRAVVRRTGLGALAARYGHWRDRAADRLGRLERHLVHDLASEVGSARWYRGLATLAVLSTTALALWPDFSRLEAASMPHYDRSVREEFRAQVVIPLALAGESSRHMGANPALVARLDSVPEVPSLQMVATLGEGDGLTRMLRRAGVGAWDAARVAELVGAVMPIADLRPGTRFDITLGQREAEGEARPLDTLVFRARFDTALSISRSNGSLTIGRQAIAVDTTPLRIRGTVGPGLYRSARAAGAPAEAVQQYLQAIDRHLGLDEVVRGDEFDIVIEQRRSAAGETETGKLLYAGLDHGGQPRVQLVRWGDKGDLFDALQSDRGMTSFVHSGGGSFMPVAGRITSSFGRRRHPILGYARMHSGVDFGAARGTPIVAVASGTVTFAGRRGGHGNFVKLDHGGGLGSGYGHMSRIAVSSGTYVSAGDVIGYVGSTGLSTGPHLHWEVYQNGRAVNPMSVSFGGVTMQAAPVDPARKDAIRKRLDAIQAIQPLGNTTTAKAESQPARPNSKLAYRD